MSLITLSGYNQLNVYYGDLHNHCDISYGHGSLLDALDNARLQLDFTSVTVHAAWPDLPTDDPNLGYIVDYHKGGFSKAQAHWNDYLKTIDQHNNDGEFVTFPSFEWHSIQYGDYCVYYQNTTNSPIVDAPNLEQLRQRLRELETPVFLIPHHIGYKQGSRGINWAAFTDELSPVAEVFSFHGLSESTDGPYPYLHSMGPRHEQSTAQYGWAQQNLFGIVGSTDHHNAFPGSYGYGRLGVWANDLSRQSIWDAIRQRRTYALTGDRIALAYTLNDALMGDITESADERWLEVSVSAGSTIDYIEVLHNNQVIHREDILNRPRVEGRYKVYVEAGWAELDAPFKWDIQVQIEQGILQDVEPRLRGHQPTATPPPNAEYAYTQIKSDAHCVHLQTQTGRNPALHTAATEGFSLEIEGTADTRIVATINGVTHTIPLSELMSGARTFYTGGFVSPAISFHRAVPVSEYQHHFAFSHINRTSNRDWYYVRVRQRNNQWAWGSPIWVKGAAT